MEKKYIVYKTTNNVNGKIYIGVHGGGSADYIGSGCAIIEAVKKHGRDSFTRETLHEYKTAKEAYQKEQEIVTKEFIERTDTYNCQVGGQGGNIPSEATRAKMRLARAKILAEGRGRVNSEEASKRLSGAGNPMYGTKRPQHVKDAVSRAQKGVKRSQETKDKISAAQLGKKFRQVECPHCKKVGAINNMSRYHFDNCKSKITECSPH